MCYSVHSTVTDGLLRRTLSFVHAWVAESAPEAVTPATGDDFQPMLVLTVALVSMMSLCVLVFEKKVA